ncbi:MAG: TolC family protein [Flavobacteriales bacterium]|nr:TolC family protein [Flavobacteriales bacterium]
MDARFENILVEVYALFTRNGIKSTTMDDVARALGISKKTLYQFVNDKPDLVSSVIAYQIELDKNVVDNIFEQGVNAIDEMIAIKIYFTNKLSEIHPSFHFDMEKYYPGTWKIFLDYKNSYVLDCVIKNMEKGVKEGYYRTDLHIPIISRIYVGRIDQIFDSGIFPVSEFNFPEVNVENMKYHIRGIASDKGLKYLDKNNVKSLFSKVNLSTITMIAIFLLSSLFSNGQTVYSLSEAQQFALKNSAVVKNSHLDVEIAKARIKEITASGLPQISGELGYNHFFDVPTTVTEARNFDSSAPAGLLAPLKFGLPRSATAGVTASQLLFDGTYIVGLQAAKVYRQLSERGVKKAEVDVKEAVATSYFMVLMANENVKIYKSSLYDIKTSLSELKLMLKNGLIDEQEVDQLQLSVSSITSTHDVAVTQKKVALEMLKYQMGLKGDAEIILSDSLDVLILSAENVELLSQTVDVKSHLDYQLITTQESLLKLDVKKEKYRRLPSVATFFSHSQNAFALDIKFDTWYPSTIFGFSANIPIWSSGVSSKRIKRAEFELEKIANTKASLVKGLEVNFVNANAEYNAAINNSRVAKRSRDLAEKILDKTILKQKEGLASSMQVTQANTQYLNAQGQYMNSIIELLTAKIKLQKALNSY